MSRAHAARRSFTPAALVWVGTFLIVVIAEIAIAVDAVRIAVVLLLLGVGALLVYASLAPFTARAFALALTLALILRIVGISLPLDQFSSYFWSLFITVPVFAALPVVLQRIGLTPAEVNITAERLPLQLVIGLLGIPIALVTYVLLHPWYPLVESPKEAAVSFVALCLAAALDEVLFRGLLQEAALVALGRMGIVYVSGLYAALQIESRSVGLVLVAFIVSLGFAWWVRRTRSVTGVVIAHMVANIGLYLVLPAIGFSIGG